MPRLGDSDSTPQGRPPLSFLHLEASQETQAANRAPEPMQPPGDRIVAGIEDVEVIIVVHEGELVFGVVDLGLGVRLKSLIEMIEQCPCLRRTYLEAHWPNGRDPLGWAMARAEGDRPSTERALGRKE